MTSSTYPISQAAALLPIIVVMLLQHSTVVSAFRDGIISIDHTNFKAIVEDPLHLILPFSAEDNEQLRSARHIDHAIQCRTDKEGAGHWSMVPTQPQRTSNSFTLRVHHVDVPHTLVKFDVRDPGGQLATEWVEFARKGVEATCASCSVDGIFNILRRPLPENVIAYVCREVVKGLIYLHGIKKIHRDIKGGNILLTKDGEVKISDFGVSTELMHSMSRRNSFIGTLYWMAPETIQEREYDERADIWSLGITLIEIAEGKPPRTDMHYAMALFAIPSHPSPQLQRKDDWSPLLHKFISKLLIKEPHQRPTAEQLLSEPFLSQQHIGPLAQQQLKDILQNVAERCEGMTTARRLGEESSDSDGSVVVRDDSDVNDGGITRRTEGGGGDSTSRLMASARGPGGFGENNAASVDDQEADLVRRCLEDGLLVPLPPCSTDEIDLSELCPGASHSSPLSVPPESEIATLLNDRETLAVQASMPVDLRPQQPKHLTQATRQLLASYQHYRHAIYRTQEVSAEEAERARALASKYGSVLKSSLRI